MADFFKKKSNTEKDREENSKPLEGGASSGAHVKRTSFLSRGPKPPREPRPAEQAKTPGPEAKLPPKPPDVKKVKPQQPPREKGPRKPLFSFGKKKTEDATGGTKAPGQPVPPGKPAEPAPQPQAAEPVPGSAGKTGVEKPEKHQGKKPHETKEEREAARAAKRAEKEARHAQRKAEREEKARARHAKGGKAAEEKRAKPKGRGGGKISPVGMDIGRSSITAVQLRHQVGGETMMAAAVDHLPEGLFQEGEVRDVEALAMAIKDFWKKHSFKGRKVELGLANQKIVVRALEFPILEEKELRTAIEFQAQDYIPIPIEEAVFDYHVLRRERDESGVEKQRVLVVAAQKNMVMDIIQAIKKAKLSVSGVDLQAFSMLRALVPKRFLEEESGGGAIALANIASDVTNLVVTVSGEPQFIRIVSFGGDNFTKVIQDYKGVSFAEAEELKMRAGLSGPSERPAAGGPQEQLGPGAQIPPLGAGPGGMALPHPGEPGTGAEGAKQGAAKGASESLADIRHHLEISADALADEIRRSLDYYMSQETSVPITKLLLSGGGAMLPNLGGYLSQIFPFEVKVGDPFRRITQNLTDLSDEQLKGLGPRLAISIGLALEDEE